MAVSSCRPLPAGIHSRRRFELDLLLPRPNGTLRYGRFQIWPSSPIRREAKVLMLTPIHPSCSSIRRFLARLMTAMPGAMHAEKQESTLSGAPYPCAFKVWTATDS